ncbi:MULTISPECIES: glycosyltransferase family 2 protein [Sporosarcina]|uniref:Glycosyltransferase involved in cell wall bisynthesis n=1 Tax=Sporosarcina newyorkensis TaxID=759851 RepID=A0A1T4YVW2_9BACL|nr:glycosyltransferase family 2 protein [Sporosarcina newyorkensis]SKB05912.1 Glycosyltransferase involved in cell wall bisynthesis [Sporosarcina newyorkensis]
MISLCMIVRDEEEVLEQCLNSVAYLCEEIVIIDTGSVDRTKEIARKFTDKIYDFEWIDDFSAARNFAFQQATKEYILWMDADDVLLKSDGEKLARLKESLDPSVDVVSMLYHVAFDEYGNPSFSFRRNRLVKRVRDFKWVGPVHEVLLISGNILASDISVTHRKADKKKKNQSKGRNLRIYEKRREAGEEFTPRDLFYFANELKDHGHFEKALQQYTEFLTTEKGWVEDIIRACLYKADCYRVLKRPKEEMAALVSTMNYDIPRPEAACRIGDIYKEKGLFQKAIFWYKTAVDIETEADMGFTNKSFSTWYPHLQLCVCYWKTGDVQAAIDQNLLAKQYRPKDPVIMNNESFFKEHRAK